MFCPYCGTENPELALFCSKCGRIIAIEHDDPATEPAPKQTQQTGDAPRAEPPAPPQTQQTGDAPRAKPPALPQMQQSTANQSVPAWSRTPSAAGRKMALQETPPSPPAVAETPDGKKRSGWGKILIPLLVIVIASGAIGGIFLMQHLNAVEAERLRARIYYVTEDGEARIVGFANAECVSFDENSAEWAALAQKGLRSFETDGKDVVLPASLDDCPVTEIGPGAFRGCTTIQSLEFPASVRVIAADAFEGCRADIQLRKAEADGTEHAAAPTTPPADEAVLAQYLAKLDAYETDWGALRRAESPDRSLEHAIGLNWARLVDFDNDGVMELILGCGAEDENGVQGVRIRVTVFAQRDGALAAVFEGEANVSDPGVHQFDLVLKDQKTLLRTGAAKDGEESWSYLAFEGGAFRSVATSRANTVAGSFYVNGQACADYDAYCRALQEVCGEPDTVLFSFGDGLSDGGMTQLRYEIEKTRDYLRLRLGQPSGRDSYREIVQTLTELGAKGSGKLFDTDGDGVEELFLTYMVGRNTQVYGAIYTRQNGRSIPLLYEEAICRPGSTGVGFGLGLVQDGSSRCYAIFCGGGDAASVAEWQRWYLLSTADCSIVRSAQYTRDGTTASACLDGRSVGVGEYTAWSDALRPEWMMSSYQSFRGLPDDSLTLQELLAVLRH